MVTFGENLKTWKDAKNKSVKDLSKNTEIGEFRIRMLLSDQENPTTKEVEALATFFNVPVATFVRGVNHVIDGNITETENEKGSSECECKEVLALYLSRPSDFRKHISAMMSLWLIAITGMNGNKLEKKLGLSNATFSKYRALKSSMSEEYIEKIGERGAKEGLFTQKAYYDRLKEICEKYVGNYNLSLAKEIYGFSAVKFSYACNCANATVSQLLSYKYSTTDAFCEKACKFFDISVQDFKTTILTKNDFKLDKYQVSKEIYSAANQFEDEKKKSHLVPKEASKEPIVVEEKVATIVETPEKIEVEEKAEITPTSKLLKMYSKLTPKHQKEVAKVIEDYFWEDI